MRALLVPVVLSASAAVTLTAVPAGAAVSPIQLGKIQYDSPGSDSGSNVSLNSEYVVLRNSSARSVALTGWTVRDAANHVYKFGAFSLGAGRTVVLRTGKGANSATTRYWGSTWYIWNNNGDKAYLRNAAGVNMDSCVWTTTAPGYRSC